MGHTGGVRRALTALLAVVATVAALVVVTGPASAVTDGWQSRMLARVNAVRAAAGVDPVRWCPALRRSADQYAGVLAHGGTFGHVSADGSGPGERIARAGYRWRNAGENLAGGPDTVYEAMQAWRASPGHLAALLNPAYEHVGFGISRTDAGREYWVQHFGAGGSC